MFELFRTGKLQEATEGCLAILERTPSRLDALHLLGLVHQRRGDLEEAIAVLARARAVAPSSAEIHNSLGTALGQAERYGEALAAFELATTLQPNYPQGWHNRGLTLAQAGRFKEALGAYQRAIALQPDYAEAYCHMAQSLKALGNASSALAACRKAIGLRNHYAEAFHVLGEVLLDEGNALEGVEAFRQAAAFRPEDSAYHSDLLFACHYLPAAAPDRLFQEHLGWSKRHEAALAIHRQAHTEVDRRSDRRLRIGYVSADFREHSCGRFIEPLLASHDHVAFEIIAYNDVSRPDAVTQRIKCSCDVWRETGRLSHEALVNLICQDRIDILVDLTGHMAHNRLPVFARRPAPVQVTYRGYTDTTGLKAMDYSLTDNDRDPEGVADGLYTERLTRLTGASQCYGWTDDDLRVAAPPVSQSGIFTFGSLNRPAKHTPQVVAVWTQILQRVPKSRLLLLGGISPPGHLQRLFSSNGIGPDRLAFVKPRRRREYLQLFNQIDLVLDPFPYNGHTTSLDGLWMGVPFVTLEGSSCISRIGFSILKAMKLDDFITRSIDEYMSKSIALARECSTLKALRPQLREVLRQSPLCDAAGHARSVEAAFRRFWRTWCEGQHTLPPGNSRDRNDIT